MCKLPSQATSTLSTSALSACNSIDLLLPDINGILRGKRVTASALEKVLSKGVYLPISLFGTNVNGDTVNDTGLGLSIGEPDAICCAVNQVVTPVPWSPGRGQLLMTMLDEQHQPFAINPRAILQRLWQQLKQLGYAPVIAVELEFYLLTPESQNTELAAPINPYTQRTDDTTQVYYMDDLDAYSQFTDAVQAACQAQDIPADAAVVEYAPGQFEINLSHSDDIVKACDDAILLKRTIKNVARQHNYIASFMAKPFAQQAGSGMHIHVSLYDDNDNVLHNQDTLHNVIGGLQHSMADAMLLFAPHANSYRRFQADMYVPMGPTWGYNNRTVALRIPAEGGKNLRIEHRIAGADANPYLVTAAVMAGIIDGLVKQRSCTSASSGDATQQVTHNNPRYWHQAIQSFSTSQWIREYFGKQFQQIFSKVKLSELNEFEQQITPTEIKWYLHTL
ncbi:glutamine synthetase family protein [Alteromonas sp. C1M14]|uniref:glutamine synthetase family protein n=1 Tax=Alteromonas sp. C1M14 TaxID=2841567 RepID=UPI001C09261F|nr:glutamine synthetase family protein [Alteromonas sp. C1M14]MBU2978539.1 glutamine synthetase family protein [Alteromonas sp. C1M14]